MLRVLASLFLLIAVTVNPLAYAASSDWFTTRYANLVIYCLGGLQYDIQGVYCKKSTNRHDGVLQDVTVSWDQIRTINHKGVTLWINAAVDELNSGKLLYR